LLALYRFHTPAKVFFGRKARAYIKNIFFSQTHFYLAIFVASSQIFYFIWTVAAFAYLYPCQEMKAVKLIIFCKDQKAGEK
jgi:hypothetical protein